MTQDMGASSGPGSREPSPDGLVPSGFDPSRVENNLPVVLRGRGRFLSGRGEVKSPSLLAAAADEIERLRAALDQIVLISCNHGGWFENDAWAWGVDMGNIARAALRDSDGSPKGGDGEAGSVHDSAGPKDIAQGGAA